MENDNYEDLVCGLNVNTYVGLMNLSVLLPSAGWIVAIVLWVTGKENRFVNEQGKHLINWFISLLIYGMALGLLFLGNAIAAVFAGSFLKIAFIPGMILLFPMSIFVFVCPIIAAVKGFNGQAWRYPLAIRFIK